MDGNVEIIFSTDGCVPRTASALIISLVVLTVVAAARFFLPILTGNWRSTDSHPDNDPPTMDRIAIYSIVALAALFLVAFAFAIALVPTNTSLLASGNRIEVRGCAKGRPFQSNFDRDFMSATHRIVYVSRSNYHELVLRQKGQRTVTIRLGDYERDSKLALIAPEAMKVYAQSLKDKAKRSLFVLPLRDRQAHDPE